MCVWKIFFVKHDELKLFRDAVISDVASDVLFVFEILKVWPYQLWMKATEQNLFVCYVFALNL